MDGATDVTPAHPLTFKPKMDRVYDLDKPFPDL
jgi:hypothetical protein